MVNRNSIKSFNLIEDYRKNNNLNKTQLAEKLGVTKGYISQILNGDFDHKISKFVDLALSFDKVPIITYKDLKKCIDDDNVK
ncbi:MAG: helix-turn-helix transcriptional regulator [Chitinophagaceae bacterium]|nr:helix-turn-helix transcriptional regulator [Chitinophagaceae bacterium]